jgi:hypothetical protein
MADHSIPAELAARITAARAARADFHARVDAYLDAGADEPRWKEQAFRLSSELASLLAELDELDDGSPRAGEVLRGGGWISGPGIS